MVRRRQNLVAVAGMLILSGVVHADMMPPYSIITSAGLSGCSDCSTIIGDLHSLPIPSFCESQGSIELMGQTQFVPIMFDGQSSLGLGVYALISLGLFRCAGLIKKVFFRVIPDWCHEGGPFQVGHSLAISPACLCSAPVHCFVQPDGGAQEHAPPYHYGAVVALWPKSQFLPMAHAPRGPPRLGPRRSPERRLL